MMTVGRMGLCMKILNAVLLLSVAGCVGADELAPRQVSDLEARKLAYHDEAYPVRLVDRRKFPKQFQPADVPAPVVEPAGTIIVDTQQKLLFLIGENGRARRYGVAVGAAGYAWSGEASVGRTAKWPAWYPTDEMKTSAPGLPERIEPGPHNPLGARALYLYKDGVDTLYRIHGTSEPWSIGTAASSGCIRMFNEDVIDLFDRVEKGSRVIVL